MKKKLLEKAKKALMDPDSPGWTSGANRLLQALGAKVRLAKKAPKIKMKPGTSEIRCPGGKLDEVVAYKPHFVHLEQMGKNLWWLRIDMPDGGAVVVWFSSKGKIKARAERD